MANAFTVRRNLLGQQPAADQGDDEAHGIPTPAKIRMQARRAAGIREARQVLEHLPAAGESLHAIVTARLDLTDVINALLDKLGRCDRMTVATLGYNRRNLKTMLAWMDAGKVANVALLASIFFRSHNGDMWTETLDEFRRRGQRAACCQSHAKVVALAFADGQRFSIEGSANLCGNGSGREQFAFIHDETLYDFHTRWITELVTKHEGCEQAKPG